MVDKSLVVITGNPLAVAKLRMSVEEVGCRSQRVVSMVAAIRIHKKVVYVNFLMRASESFYLKVTPRIGQMAAERAPIDSYTLN